MTEEPETFPPTDCDDSPHTGETDPAEIDAVADVIHEPKPKSKRKKTPVKPGPAKRVMVTKKVAGTTWTYPVVTTKSTSKPPTKEAKPKVKRIDSDLSGGLKVGSTRVRLFKALAKTDETEGFSANEVKKKTGMAPNSGHLSVILVEEVERGRVKVRTDYRGKEAKPTKVYYLTGLGRRDFTAGKIDSSPYAGKRIGQVWTDARKSAE